MGLYGQFEKFQFKKSIDLLDYKEIVSFEEGLKNMWSWAKTQPIYERK